jgi:hypothetical protein
MAVYQTQLHFSQNDQGWSEKWFRDSGAETNLEVLWPVAEALATKRATLLAREAKIKAIGVSFEAQKFDSVLKFVSMLGNQQAGCALPDDTVVVRFRSQNALANKNVFLRGIPDDAIINGDTLNLAGNPAWFQAVGDWANFILVNQYGWWGQTPGVDGLVIGYVQNIDGTVTIDTGPNFFAAGDVDKFLRVNLAGVNGKNGSTLNGQITVLVKDADQCETVDRIAVFPFISPGKIHKFTYTLRPAIAANIDRAGSRRPGKPFGQRRGRAKEKLRG